MINAVSDDAPGFMILQHVNVKPTSPRRFGRRQDPALMVRTSSNVSTCLDFSVTARNQELQQHTRRSSLPHHHRNFSYQDFSIDGKLSNIDLHMLSPTQVLDFKHKGCASVKQSPFYSAYRNKLNTPHAFRLHRDDLTDITRKPKIERQQVHALYLLKKSKLLTSPRLLRAGLSSGRKPQTTPLRSAQSSMRPRAL